MKPCKKIVCILVPVENHKDGYIHNMETTKMNDEIEFHVLGIKVEFPFELIGVPKMNSFMFSHDDCMWVM